MKVQPRERFSSQVQLSPDSVADFARAAGDMNPLHHDAEFAARSRFGKLIASGPQTSAMLMALTASHFSKSANMLGLDFWFRFKKPVLADESVKLEWMVISVQPCARLAGDLVDLRGRLVNESGQTAVGAKGRVLILNEPAGAKS